MGEPRRGGCDAGLLETRRTHGAKIMPWLICSEHGNPSRELWMHDPTGETPVHPEIAHMPTGARQGDLLSFGTPNR